MYIYNLCTYYNTIYHYIQVFIHIICIFIYHHKYYILSYKKKTPSTLIGSIKGTQIHLEGVLYLFFYERLIQ